MADLNPLRKPTLDLSTLVERPFIRVDGESYDIYHPDEFSLLDRMTLFQRFDQAMQAAKRVTAASDPVVMREAAEQASTLLDTACRSALVAAPEALHAKLRDTHRVHILKAFTQLLADASPTAEANAAAAARVTAAASGTNLCPDSSASTGATPTAG